MYAINHCGKSGGFVTYIQKFSFRKQMLHLAESKACFLTSVISLCCESRVAIVPKCYHV